MKILFASAEAYPLAKVGGLGDVAGSLPKAIRSLGHDVRMVLPRYGMIRGAMDDQGAFKVRGGGSMMEARLKTTDISGLPFYLIDQPGLFDRPKVYEYEDDGKRFGFFGRAILDLLPLADFWPDVIHLNDWHSAIASGFLRTLYADDERYRRIKTVLTIHNLQHQGIFSRELFDWLELPAAMWNPEAAEFYGQFNFLKAGIVYADFVTTVSPTYAKEIQTEEYGCRLDGLLRSRSSKLIGILNGIDYDVWNPAKDPILAKQYSKSTIEKKEANKAALQKETGLPGKADVPLLGMVSRVTEQKGFDILIPALPELLREGVQIVLLGAGEKKFETPLIALAASHPGFVAYLKYDEAFAHRIYAGSDFFLMPSRFEPCGLGQMISLRYGTLPIARVTGGLADTVTDVTADPARGNGFTFQEYTPAALLDATRRAVAFFRARRRWKTMRQRAMALDLSWNAAAKQYASLYDRVAGA